MALECLETLCIFNNELTDIPESMSQLTNLKELDIRWNELALVTSKNLSKLKAHR